MLILILVFVFPLIYLRRRTNRTARTGFFQSRTETETYTITNTNTYTVSGAALATRFLPAFSQRVARVH